MTKNLKLAGVVLTSILALLFVSFSTGCATNGGGVNGGSGPTFQVNTNTITILAPALQTTAAEAVIYAYTKDKNAVKYIDVVATAINQFALSPNLDANALRAAIDALPIKELKTPEAQLLITPVIAAYRAYGEQLVKQGVNQNYALQTLLKALVDGIADGKVSIGQVQANGG